MALTMGGTKKEGTAFQLGRLVPTPRGPGLQVSPRAILGVNLAGRGLLTSAGPGEGARASQC